ncbi:hypothetical protein OPQ81_007069 [Rhizoctonia solani]|nr:hypothetical protein OPQ81_007069 [Rhizoctonia solani]
MVFQGITSVVFRNQFVRLSVAPSVWSHARRPNAPSGVTSSWRTYTAPPPSNQGHIEHDVNKNQDLFVDNSTNETGFSENHTSADSLPELEHEDPLMDETDHTQGIDEHEVPGDIHRPKYISRGKLLAAHRARVIPELKEEDLEEMFVRGSGPGGQAINKTSSSVSLIHRPTGIRVQCQATRSREQNRKIARKIMVEKLDQLANPGLSKLQLEQEKIRAKKRQRAKKAKKRAKQRAEGELGADNSEDSEQTWLPELIR